MRPASLLLFAAFAAACSAPARPGDTRDSAAMPVSSLDSYIEARLAEFDGIDPGRRRQLVDLAGVIARRVADSVADSVGELDADLEVPEELPIIFICTHNSRRSHMGQIWAQLAADRFGVPGVRTYSGGSEVTAFHPHAISALRRAGLAIEAIDVDAPNPRYAVERPGHAEPMTCFSKTFGDAMRSQSNFVAVMTCSSADDACPIVPGASQRVALPYLDPKASDGTEREAAAYDERCAQIARELLFTFWLAADQGTTEG